MTDVFINYRTGDEENVAALLAPALSNRFAPEVFFHASKSIRFGDDYTQALPTAVRRSVALLAVIGTRWLDVRDGGGRRKIDDPADWTRREILEAFHHNVRVIPVLVGSARRLKAEDLPPELTRLAFCEYARLRSRDVDADLDRLAVELARLVPELRDRQNLPPGSVVVENVVENKAYDNSQVGVQGGIVFTGDFDFGGPRDKRDPR